MTTAMGESMRIIRLWRLRDRASRYMPSRYLACVDGALSCRSNRSPVNEVCNNDDDDCDGSVDEVPGVGDACSAGIGLCRVDGLRVCSPGVGLVCSANAGSPVAERCDGLDNDCDGRRTKSSF